MLPGEDLQLELAAAVGELACLSSMLSRVFLAAAYVAMVADLLMPVVPDVPVMVAVLVAVASHEEPKVVVARVGLLLVALRREAQGAARD